MKRLVFFLLILGTLAACDSSKVFEENYDFDNRTWHLDTIPSFEFNIDNTSPKSIFINLRNTISYGYQNIYLTYYLHNESGETLESELINIQVFDEKTGKPFGSGSSVYEHKVPLLTNYQFPGSGSYTIKVAQYMRELDLREIASVGVRVENQD